LATGVFIILCLFPRALNPDIGGAITAGVAHLVGSSRATWLLTEIDIEVLVDLQATILRVAIDLQDIRSCFGKLGIELVIPATEERVGHVQALPIQAKLEHLWPTQQLVTLDIAAIPEQPTAPDLPGKSGIGGITDIILADITMQPIL